MIIFIFNCLVTLFTGAVVPRFRVLAGVALLLCGCLAKIDDLDTRHARSHDYPQQQQRHIRGNPRIESSVRPNFGEGERLGELYYRDYIPVRHMGKGAALINVLPAYPCVRGVEPIGLDTAASISDGHKFGCGISYISHAPIVYSFGSYGVTDFEIGFHKIRNDSVTYTFELEADKTPNLNMANYHFFNIGLGYNKEDSRMRSLLQIMDMLNHTYIDVLKMDIEGAEWQFILREYPILQNVGQFLVELHGGQTGSVIEFLETIEKTNLRLFFKDLNKKYAHKMSELSFVQSNWTYWDAYKKDLVLPRNF